MVLWEVLGSDVSRETSLYDCRRDSISFTVSTTCADPCPCCLLLIRMIRRGQSPALSLKARRAEERCSSFGKDKGTKPRRSSRRSV